MQVSEMAELNRKLDEAAQSMVPADLRERGWRYVDIPGRWTPDAWGLLLDLMGDGEFRCIAMTAGTNKHGEVYRRGQFFISPQGIANLGDKERYARLAAEATP